MTPAEFLELAQLLDRCLDDSARPEEIAERYSELTVKYWEEGHQRHLKGEPPPPPLPLRDLRSQDEKHRLVALFEATYGLRPTGVEYLPIEDDGAT